jgi:hypothetical protein
MKTLIAYVLVVPLSYIAFRLGVIVATAPIAFALIKASVWFRSTICGVVGGIGGVVAAVAFGCCVFSLVVGPGTFTLFPFLASVLMLTISIQKDVQFAQAQTRADFQTSGKDWLSNQVGNFWGVVVGDVCGLVLATAWFFLVHT